MSEENHLIRRISDAAAFLRSELKDFKPEVGIALGSGLGPLAEDIEEPLFIPYEEVPHMKSSTATGHVGCFVCGMLAGKRAIAMQGRLHGYEGYSAQDVAFPIWLVRELGASVLITTNAAGAINESYEVGDFCIMSDHINFTGRNPLVGVEPDELAFRFVSMMDAFDPELRALTREVAASEGIRVQEGVYLALLGPSFETPAEIRAFRTWGADTVAMSVVEEVIAARHVGMRVLGVSLISNMACGIGDASPNDTEIFEVAFQRVPDFCKLITEVVRRI